MNGLQDRIERLTGPALARAAPHGFFTRRGGVSTGPYASLNGSLSGGDDRAAVLENRARATEATGGAPAGLVGLRQVHGTDVVRVTEVWAPGAGPEADGMVTSAAGVSLAIVTADCAPVLLADPAAMVVGAAHAGWRGAVAGVLERTVAAMLELGARAERIAAAVGPCIGQASYEVGAAHAGWRGAVAGVLERTVAAMLELGARAERIAAAVGPCIGQASYEVGADLRDAVLAADPGHDGFFTAGRRAGHWQFDLAGYCAARLRGSGVGVVDVLGADTAANPEAFFSHRRRTLAGGGPIGHQLSVIRCPTS